MKWRSAGQGHTLWQMSEDNGKTYVITEDEAGTRLDKWLAAAERLGSRSRALAAIDHGKIFAGGVEQTAADTGRRLVAGESIRIWIDRPGSSRRRYSERRKSDLHILYEDAALIVINKPAGLLTVPLPAQPDAPSLLEMVRAHLKSGRRSVPLVVHRIDRDTSGIVLFAKSVAAREKLKEQFEKRKAERTYLAVVHGTPEPETGIWRDRLVWDSDELVQRAAGGNERKAIEASCRYRVVEKLGAASLLEVNLITGKRNQIRFQASLHGHPVVGERIYFDRESGIREIPFARQALHAWRLKFDHPVEGHAMSLEARLPEDINALLERLRRRPKDPGTGLSG